MLQQLPQGDRSHRKKLAAVARCAALGQIDSDEGREVEEEVVDEALAAFGVYAVRPVAEAEPLYLWPENVRSWHLFQATSTQWLSDANGKTGLNYPGVEVVMRMWRIRRKEELKVFQEIQAMEWAALGAWKEKNE